MIGSDQPHDGRRKRSLPWNKSYLLIRQNTAQPVSNSWYTTASTTAKNAPTPNCQLPTSKSMTNDKPSPTIDAPFGCENISLAISAGIAISIGTIKAEMINPFLFFVIFALRLNASKYLALFSRRSKQTWDHMSER